MASKQSFTYKDAGVDIDKGNRLVELIKSLAKSTQRPEIIGNVGGFGALCKIPKSYANPILVSATDGVGTKLKIAFETNIHNTIGIDLVAMCANDLVVVGAEPLQFLDYFATGTLNVEVATQVIEGIAEGCKQAGCALVGGETAEMPDMYKKGEYDLAGFCQGVMEEGRVIEQSKVRLGDILVGIKSSGLHSNGYSLVRKIIKANRIDLQSARLDGKLLSHELLTPTRIYVKSLLKLIRLVDVHALAHITGGGLLENIPRVMPKRTCAKIDDSTWQMPEIFNWVKKHGNVASEEMYRSFNCGIGMVIAISPNDVDDTINILKASGEQVTVIGEIAKSSSDEPSVEIASLRPSQ